MGRAAELTGQRFGRLTVLSRAENGKHGNTRWLCRCDCGNEKIVPADNLLYGYTKSCGCLKYIDLTGQRFGRLTVKERVPGRRGSSALWRCACDCGGTRITSASALKRGMCISCGCIAKESAKESIKNADKYRRQYFIGGTDVKGLTSKPTASSTSGVRGVYWHERGKVWFASIMFRQKSYYLGSSKNFDVAVELRKEGERRIWGDFLDWYNNKRRIPVMTDKQIYYALSEAQNYTEPEAFASDILLSSMFEIPGSEEIQTDLMEPLITLWHIACDPFRDLLERMEMTQAQCSTRFCIGYRTVQRWAAGDRQCPVYIRLMMAELAGIFKR